MHKCFGSEKDAPFSTVVIVVVASRAETESMPEVVNRWLPQSDSTESHKMLSKVMPAYCPYHTERRGHLLESAETPSQD